MRGERARAREHVRRKRIPAVEAARHQNETFRRNGDDGGWTRGKNNPLCSATSITLV